MVPGTAFAYVTLLTKTSYLPGVLVLHHGLRAVESKHPLVVMVTPSLPRSARDVLRKQGITLREVETLQPREGHATHLIFSNGSGFELVEFERIVLLDSDMIIRRNMDDLMELDLPKDEIAAVHVCACNPRKLAHYPSDWIPENCAHTAVTHPGALPPPATPETPRPYHQLNSGTVVLNPSKELLDAIVHFLQTSDKIATFSFPDQDLLTAFFEGKWRPISWYYNALRTLRFVHPQEWSDEEVRCLHYILPDKPWQSRVTPPDSPFATVNGWWWEQFDAMIVNLECTDSEGWKLMLANVDNVH
ncbi:glycosyltransferase family 8 protein [Laccaria bicolor S238N-H82]|uniref:Glycosyltransferase family 8 protein n=1 Tax=Laccaria bicolor (strain S238N-H82 / ATCC MYA-4686) TaxID=486041 RepID=B0CQH6_LACBS|nr:glycosyltransferase family 8 protein [Laccaria bicolor S238N-H82]EDR15646.1 glycosyltransferase family 8 protein [Laccaria bicolor S238N-H82]|eukprot:XP_001873854.1 glycosyltransferase family 8 protein [Laccaria bicolor S238N-H82]